MLFTVFDTETTGLTVHHQAPLGLQPRPIEFAGIITDGKEIIDTLELIINPEIIIEEIITKLTGLTNEDLEVNKTFAEQHEQIADFISRGQAIIAHNMSFDKNIIDYAARRIGLTLDDMKFPKIQICTVEQFYPQFGRRMKLQELYELFIGKYTQKHRALDDIMMLHKICQTQGVYDIFGD
ncbi:DNA polymerase III subunit epsilon [Pantoea phage Kyle]|uniref:DNA polymerase III subunit epsilon n=1 Tax=Pantoea phage Kyle TaxID=2589665 RepID=A0A514A8N4_9CAUD|nr:DNA polymerase exonuclease subunit [Pantoea phage Kyle]QDH49631.1 DNA polymerase III subunit epsilon [Pantoea phage Kyle]